MLTQKFMWIVVVGLGVIVLGLSAYAAYFVGVVNPAVTEELRTEPQGERAKKVMLLTLPGGQTIPVNYLREGQQVFAGADGAWWKAFAGTGAGATLLIQGNELTAHGKAVLDDNDYRDKVFARLRPTVPTWMPEWGKGTLIVFTLSQP